MKAWRFFSLAVCALFLWLSPIQAAPIRVAYSAISGAMAPLWVTQESGFFKREGLDVELLYIGGGSLLIQAMLGGDVQFAYGPSVPVIQASLRGADLVFIANTGNTMIFSIMSRPEVRGPSDLRGKKVGVTRLGGSTDLALDFALKKWGLQRGRDVAVLQTGGMPESLAALHSGALQAAVLSPPSNIRAKKLGMRELAEMGQLGVVYPNTPLSTTRAHIRAHRDEVIKFLRAFSQGLHRLRTDGEFSKRVLAKYTSAGDPEILDELYQIYGVRYTGDPVPYVRLEGVGGILKRIGSKEGQQAKPEHFIDHSLLTEIERAGFFRRIFR